MSDLISRAALLEFAHNHINGYVDCNDIARFPSVDAEPVRHGRWLNKGYITTAYGSIDTGDCSACGAVDVPIEPYDYYCPNCGAKMDKEG